MSIWLLVGIGLHLVGLAVTFSGAGLRGRVVGLALVSAGAGIAVAVAPPVRSWPATLTVAATLVPLVVVAALLRQRVAQVAGPEEVTLDDDAL
jgi:ascorbate-specific PTS system EIIC-type component UlaA